VGRGLIGDIQRVVCVSRVAVYELMYLIEDSVEKVKVALGGDLVLHANIVE
jgi:hypothetical protein